MKRLTQRMPNEDIEIICDVCYLQNDIFCSFPSDCFKVATKRLADIEDILGDNYDLDHLRRLIEADKKSKNDDYWPFQK